MYTYTICDKMKQETIIRWVKKGYGMGKQDLLAKKYMSDNEKFADVFNYYLYNGKQVIKSELKRRKHKRNSPSLQWEV